MSIDIILGAGVVAVSLLCSTTLVLVSRRRINRIGRLKHNTLRDIMQEFHGPKA